MVVQHAVLAAKSALQQHPAQYAIKVTICSHKHANSVLWCVLSALLQTFVSPVQMAITWLAHFVQRAVPLARRVTLLAV